MAVTHGKHAFKFGAEFRPVRLPTFQPNQTHGQMSFTKNMTNDPSGSFAGVTGDAMASFELGYLSAFAFSSPSPSNQQHYALAFYTQDDWKVTPKLTVNLGVRYELVSPFFDNGIGSANLVPANNPSGWVYEVAAGPNRNIPFTSSESSILAAAGIPVTIGQVNKYVVPWDKYDFGPRLGLAYQLMNKTVVRAAYGSFYDGEQNRGGYIPLDENAPFAENINYTGPTYTLDPYIPRLSGGFPTNILNLNIPSSISLHGVAPDLLNPDGAKVECGISTGAAGQHFDRTKLPGQPHVALIYCVGSQLSGKFDRSGFLR